MLGLMMLATAAGGGSEPAFAAWRACIGETTRVAAHEGRLPEEMPVLLRTACQDQRARYVRGANGAAATARTDALIGSYVRRYAVFYTTGLWPER